MDAVSIEECIYRVNMAHMVKSGQLRANISHLRLRATEQSSYLLLVIILCSSSGSSGVIIKTMRVTIRT